MIIGGQSLGGWASIMSTVGDQEYFKVCLAHDPAGAAHRDEVLADELIMKHPTHMVQSSGFYGPMCKLFFNYTTGF